MPELSALFADAADQPEWWLAWLAVPVGIEPGFPRFRRTCRWCRVELLAVWRRPVATVDGPVTETWAICPVCSRRSRRVTDRPPPLEPSRKVHLWRVIDTACVPVG